MARIKELTYGRTQNLGDYNSMRIDITMQVDEGDDFDEVMGGLKAQVMDVLGKLIWEYEHPGAKEESERDPDQHALPF